MNSKDKWDIRRKGGGYRERRTVETKDQRSRENMSEALDITQKRRRRNTYGETHSKILNCFVIPTVCSTVGSQDAELVPKSEEQKE